ncbi:unnamed protein product [Arabidopsis halleri]
MAEDINLELSLQTNHSMIVKKKLTQSYVDYNCRLHLPKRAFEQFIIPEMEWELIMNLKNSVEVIVKDVNGNEYHVTLIQYQNGDYCFVGKWMDIVRAKGYKKDDVISLLWDKTNEIFYII